MVGVIGNNVFTSLDRMDIHHGRVLAPMNDSFPSRGGFVESAEVFAGQRVQAGDILIRLRDPQLMADLEQAADDIGQLYDSFMF